jgi:hypothetical protein
MPIIKNNSNKDLSSRKLNKEGYRFNSIVGIKVTENKQINKYNNTKMLFIRLDKPS